jgi:uncharacterized protein YcbK (DUF882 family)
VNILRKGRRAAVKGVAHRAGWSLAALAVLVVSTQNTQDAVANGDTRALRLYHNHTKESLTVTFRKNGQYDARALEQLNWFLRDWRRDEPTSMDPRLFDTLWAVYREVGSDEAIHVNSAYRSPTTNAMLRRRSSAVAKNSQHMRGKAMDFYLPDVSIDRIRSIGMRLQNGGVGYYPSAYTPFVHLDVGSVRAWPRMTRDQLARIFPDGKTVHIPADGQPMPRYEEARAEILARGGSVAGYTAYAEAGEAAAPAPQRKSLWASLFGSDDDEDADEASTARGRQAYVPRRAPPPNIYNNDSPGAALAQYEASQAAPMVMARAAPPREPEPEVQARAPEPEAPRTPATRIAGLPSTVDTPAGPRLAWQHGPAGQASAGGPEIAFAPMPPRRPDDVMVTGALAFAPVPPARPSSLAATNPIAGPAGLLVALQGIDHPAPPPRPSRSIAVASASPDAISMPTVPTEAATKEPAKSDRDQLRALAAHPPAAHAPAVPSRTKPAPVPLGSLLTAGPSLTTSFSTEPMGDLATNRFTGPAVKPLSLVR